MNTNDLSFGYGAIQTFVSDEESLETKNERKCAQVVGFNGKASIPSEIASVTKNLIGSGVLSLSGGIALYSNDPSIIMSSAIWLISLGCMSCYSAILIAKVCDITNSSTYRSCWESTVKRGSLLVAMVSMLAPAQGDLAYVTILSYTLKSLLESVQIYWSRVTCLLFITVVALLPLCLKKDFDGLSGFSTFGVASVFVAMIAMLIRCFDGSYSEGGKFYDDIRVKPYFGSESHQWSRLIFPYLCMIFQAWVMHYNTPRFYTELKDASIPRFTKVLGCSFGLAAMMYIAIAAAGFWTFGGHSLSYILNNYSPNDPLATLSRLCVFLSTLLIYPLAFIGVRDASLDILRVPPHKQTDTFLNVFTVILLSILTVLAVFFDDLGLINAIGGGTFVTALCFVFPALMYRNAVNSMPSPTRSQQREVVIAMLLMVIGVGLGTLGVYQSIYEALKENN